MLIQSSLEKLYGHLIEAEEIADQLLPNFSIQNQLDKIYRQINDFCQRIESPPYWLKRNSTDGHLQLRHYLENLPKHIAYEIIASLKSIIQIPLQAALYGITHPVKAPIELAKKTVLLMAILSKPEIWAQIGANIMGSSLGYSLITLTPLSPIFLIISATMMAAGISFSSFKNALNDKIATHNIPTKMIASFVTSFSVAFVVGGIQQIAKGIHHISEHYKYQSKLTKMRDKQLNQFIQENRLPRHQISFKNKNSATLYYSKTNQALLPKKHISQTRRVIGEIQTGSNYTKVYDRTVIETIHNKTYITPQYRTEITPIYTKMHGLKVFWGKWPAPTKAAIPPINTHLWKKRLLSASIVTPIARKLSQHNY